MADFEERSGIVSQETPWGKWHQTVSDVTIEVNLVPGTRGREVRVDIQPASISCSVKGTQIFQGRLCETVIVDESTWTIEDSKLLRILLVKGRSSCSGGCWSSLLQDQFPADPLTFHTMRQKLDLERYQLENPGFDFSGATLDKKYEDFPGIHFTEDLSHMGATALPPSLSLSSENKTDDEKLREAQRASLQDGHQAVGAAVAEEPESSRLQQLNLVDEDSTSDDARMAASSLPVPDPVVTDDMKTSAGDSLETDEEKGGE